jgi:aminoglycoside phosphotransferase (APT) family kinase protein
MSSITASTEDIIHKLRPQAQAVKPMEGGIVNDVFLVDDEVFRFPKEEGGKQVLLYEAAILDKLAGKMSLNIPELREVASDGSYIIISYVDGEMLSSKEITAFNPEQKKLLAKTIVQCLREINAALSIEEVKQLVKKYIAWQVAEDEFYQSILNRNTKSKYHPLYVSYYERYIRHQKKVGKVQEIVVYGDFHYGNMLFTDKRELIGLVDFGDVNIGTIVTEFRQIYRLGPDIAEHMITESDDAFGLVDLELIKLHAIIHEVWVLMRTEGKEPPKDGRDKLAKELLSQWIGKNWGEL